MPLRDVIHESRTTRTILKVVTILFIAAIIVPGIFLIFVAINPKDLPRFATFAIDNIFPFFSSIKGDLLSMFVASAPVVLVGVCYKSGDQTKDLNFAGVTCFLLALIGFFTGLFASVIFKSASANVADFGDETSLLHLTQSAQIVTRSSLFYLAIFLGIGGSQR